MRFKNLNLKMPHSEPWSLTCARQSYAFASIFSSFQDDHSESWDVLRHEASQQEAHCCQETGGAHAV